MRTEHTIENGILKEYCWGTEHTHSDNMQTMSEYLEEHLVDGAVVLLQDGTYSEVRYNGLIYGVYASGDGTFDRHRIRFELLEAK